jgi:hypothetical protein
VIFVALGLCLFAALVWVGRQAAWRSQGTRLSRAMGATLGAVAAVVAGARGDWVASLALIGVSAWLGGSLRLSPRIQEPTSVAEARSILGVGPQAGRDEIEAAYRRLIRRVHPDAGGAEGLAALLNAARDRLIK